MGKVTIGIDNGVTGSVGIITDSNNAFFKTPVRQGTHYTKTKTTINLLDWDVLKSQIMSVTLLTNNVHAYLERPFVNPKFFNTSNLAVAVYLMTRQALEMWGIGHTTIDSKDWQKHILPGFKGTANLKKGSRIKGGELYPHHKQMIVKQKDADGLLIAHYFHNK